MQAYYKIITEYSWFRKIYDTDDVSSIPFGTCVSAVAPFSNDECYQNSRNGRWYIDKPVIHFCDNAFDTMLWHSVLVGTIIPKKYQIYQIKPITPVVKERCKDDGGFYQCGASEIKILGKVNVNDMYDLAVADFRENHNAKIHEYPHLQMTKIISDWLHHKQSEYIY